MPLFLGFDLSTQQLKAILVDEHSAVVHESAVHFDSDLPAYRTNNGAIRGPDEGEVSSPVRMWLEAIDLVVHRVKHAGVDLSAVVAISGAAQQHGSVYWSDLAETSLSSMDPSRSLTEPGHLAPHAFALPNAPIWQDSSTAKDCADLEDAAGGPQRLADLTGSRAYERFTGPQIARVRALYSLSLSHTRSPPPPQIRRLKPNAYRRSARISLVSSFMPSLFLGYVAPIEISDASGMNLMDVMTCKWIDSLLDVCGGPDLRSKIGPQPVPGGTVLGKISNWWVLRWGFSPECIIAPFTGDNSATVAALSAPGDALLSLGTSTTLLLSIPPADTPPKRPTTSHLLSHPTTIDAQIAMLCYKNGALAREHVRDRHANRDWEKYNQLVESTPVGNNGYLGFYFPLPEIIPPNVCGEFLFTTRDGHPTPVDSIPSEAHPRAILESQFLSIKSRIVAILPPNSPPLQRMVVIGGSSANQTIRQLAADLFGIRVYVPESKEAAGTGGAILAKFAWWKQQNGGSGTFEEMSYGDVERMRLVAEPRSEVTKGYDRLVDAYHTPPGPKRPFLEKPSSSEPLKRARLEQDNPASEEKVALPDALNVTPPESSSRVEKHPGRRDAAGWAKSRKGKEKQTRNVGRRRGPRHAGPSETPKNEELEDEGPKPPRLPKRMTALLLGFCGTGCSGMQIQPNVRTIEGVLFDALVRAGAVSDDNADDPTKVNLGRAARTDAGVHAAGNVVSMKLIVNIPGVKDWVSRVNEELPPEIHVWGKVRVQGGFNARLSCDSRKYTYFFPSYLLIPPKPNSACVRSQHTAVASRGSFGDIPQHPFWDFPGVDSSSPEEDLARKRQWRVSAKDVDELRATAKKFEGTHNFHNFTVGRDFPDRSNQRNMIKIQIADPAVYGDTEWISVLFHGQSFMLHQIRKMMSALVLSHRTGTPADIIDELYGPRVVLVPKMPALGLLLEYPIFDSYNQKVTTVNEREKYDGSHVDFRPPIDFEQYRERIDTFKQKFIYEDMRTTEDRYGIFDAWIRYVDNYEGNDLLYLNPRGIIPASAVIKKDVKRRPKPFKESKRFDITNIKELKDEPPLEEESDSEEENISKPALEDMEG
ncbi:hypothetical protein J3R82DRAFT_2469 [Butyriboletus roseoflavus]|nr:hypothetical protein J3R82DRAFT_2469 [Butyriboletus roseoflavus]